MSDEPAPASMRQAGPRDLEIVWQDGHVSVYPVAYLRRACRCASCVDEWTGAQILKAEQVPEDVRPVRIDPVGRYAVHFTWSDGHTSGIYSFDHLRAICPCAECAGR
ncbi:MAG: DUF971 domain-containing protein [Planctomycetes bacterium]|nr:DUF971 domain-containing protein [Planctomycetota bacterium]